MSTSEMEISRKQDSHKKKGLTAGVLALAQAVKLLYVRCTSLSDMSQPVSGAESFRDLTQGQSPQ